MENRRDDWCFETRTVRGSQGFDPATGSVSFPIYQSATFRHPALNETTGWDYSRQGNPTRTELEQTLAILEGGSRGFAFSTGMAAIAAVMDLFSIGDHVILSEDLYGGTYRLFDEQIRRRGITFDYIDTRDLDKVKAGCTSRTRLILVETPSNPMARVSDIAALAVIAHENGALLAVDNTFLSPYFQKPLALGADISIHSGTKFIGGHNDTLSGILVCSDAELGEKLFLIQKTTGATLSPFDSWLVLRGLKTLAVRMRQMESNAKRIAAMLTAHPAVEKVFYAGLPDHPEYALSCRQTSGFGSMISFRLREKERVAAVLEKVRLILFAESLGGVESLITFPFQQTHAAIPRELRDALGVDEHLLRLSVGIEDADDLIRDLEQALS